MGLPRTIWGVSEKFMIENKGLFWNDNGLFWNVLWNGNCRQSMIIILLNANNSGTSAVFSSSLYKQAFKGCLSWSVYLSSLEFSFFFPPIYHTHYFPSGHIILPHLEQMNVEIIYFVSYGCLLGFPGGSVVKNLHASSGDSGLILGSGRSPGVGNGNPLYCPCLENSMDRGGWWASVLVVAKSWMQLSDWACTGTLLL